MDINKIKEAVTAQNPLATFTLETVKHKRYQATVNIDNRNYIVFFKVPLDKALKKAVPSSKIIKYLSFD